MGNIQFEDCTLQQSSNTDLSTTTTIAKTFKAIEVPISWPHCWRWSNNWYSASSTVHQLPGETSVKHCITESIRVSRQFLKITNCIFQHLHVQLPTWQATVLVCDAYIFDGRPVSTIHVSKIKLSYVIGDTKATLIPVNISTCDKVGHSYKLIIGHLLGKCHPSINVNVWIIRRLQYVMLCIINSRTCLPPAGISLLRLTAPFHVIPFYKLHRIMWVYASPW